MSGCVRAPRFWSLLAQAAVSATCAIGLMACGCGGKAESEPAPSAKRAKVTWLLTSKAFPPGGRIPAKYTADGKDISPDLSWAAPPAGTAQLALICDDPDAPRGTWVHWVLYGLPPNQRSLPEAVPRSETLPKLGGAKQGRNSWGEIGYRGPSPPKGPAHHYHFKLYALNAPVTLKPGAEKAQLEKEMRGHILGQAELVGLYGR